MNDVIQFLEALACDPHRLDGSDWDAAVAAVDGPARGALLARDPAAIAAALGLAPTLACMIVAPEQDEPAQDDHPADGDGDGEGDGETPAEPSPGAA